MEKEESSDEGVELQNTLDDLRNCGEKAGEIIKGYAASPPADEVDVTAKDNSIHEWARKSAEVTSNEGLREHLRRNAAEMAARALVQYLPIKDTLLPHVHTPSTPQQPQATPVPQFSFVQEPTLPAFNPSMAPDRKSVV